MGIGQLLNVFSESEIREKIQFLNLDEKNTKKLNRSIEHCSKYLSNENYREAVHEIIEELYREGNDC